jgi:hypothetical protein
MYVLELHSIPFFNAVHIGDKKDKAEEIDKGLMKNVTLEIRWPFCKFYSFWDRDFRRGR